MDHKRAEEVAANRLQIILPLMDPAAVFALEPANDQHGTLPFRCPEYAFPAPGNSQDTVTMRSLAAPYIKVFSVPALRSRR